MKLLFRLLPVLFLISQYGYAQVPHTLTIAELQQLADCPDQYCLGSRVNQENYTYKGPQKGKSNGLEGTQYRYIRPHPNPMFTEFAASYWVMKDNSRRVSFTSDNKVWIAGLQSAIEQSGFTFVRQKGMFGDKEYILNEGGRTWHLNWAEPRLLVDTEPHTLTVYCDTQPTNQPNTPPISVNLPTQMATIPPLPGEPHLGGHWDASYPVIDAGKLLEAERRYAADYERGHGKTGNTFSRCEKFRIQGKVRGQYRPLTTERWESSFDMALKNTSFNAFADNRTKLFKQEALVEVAGELIWMPIQEILIKTLATEAKAGETITLYALLVSYHDFGGTLHLSFLINEFAAASTTDSFDPKPETAQPTTELVPPPRLAKPTTTAPQKAATGCGFNWVPWNKITQLEKNEMRKVMVTEIDAPNVSLLKYISDALSEGHKIQVARHDFYKDGERGFVVYMEYKQPQSGFKGQIDVYEGLGKTYLFPGTNVTHDLCAVRPSDTDHIGIIKENGQLEYFTVSPFFEQIYARFLKGTKPAPPATISTPSVSTSRSGAATPEDLAILLLKCLKTNDKTTWMRCMHPNDGAETDELSARRFDQYRECLDEKGLTNWPSMVYSRMTHLAHVSGSKIDLSKTRSMVSVEFTYKNQEFVGEVNFGAFSKVGNKWLVWAAGIGDLCGMTRSMH